MPFSSRSRKNDTFSREEGEEEEEEEDEIERLDSTLLVQNTHDPSKIASQGIGEDESNSARRPLFSPPCSSCLSEPLLLVAMNSPCSEKQALCAPEAIAADVACDAAPSHSCNGNGVIVVRILFCEEEVDDDDINCC